MSEDTKLNDATQVVALGYSVVAALSDNAQVTFHSAIADDDSDDVANAKLDRIMRLVNRQRVLGEVPGIEKELRDLEDKLAQLKEDEAFAEANHQKEQASLQVQAEKLRAALTAANAEAETQHAASGRGGSYAPRGHVKTNIDRAKSGLDGVLGALVKNENEVAQTKANLNTTKERMGARVDLLKTRLAEIDELKG